jgi:hypothetical protein
LLLTLVVFLGLVVASDLNSNPSGKVGTGSVATSCAHPFVSLSNLDENVVRSSCPRTRRLRLGEVDTSVFVEIALCSTSCHRSQGADDSQNSASIRFARIIAAEPATGDQADEWIQVRCPNIECLHPEPIFSILATRNR